MDVTITDSVKAVGEYTVKGTALVYGGRDLVGDTFTKETDLGETRPFIGMPVYFDHSGGRLESQIGEVKAWIPTDEGIDVEIEIYKSRKYARDVMKLVKSGHLGMSTGAVSHLVVRNAGELKRWVIGELSLTATPAEPRTIADVKAVGVQALLSDDETVGNILRMSENQNQNKQEYNRMSINKDELKAALQEIAGEPVVGGGIVTGQAPAHLKNVGGDHTGKAAQMAWLRTGKVNDEVKAIMQEDAGTWGVTVAHDLQRDIVAKRDEMSVLSQLPITRLTTSKEYYDINTENAKASFGFVGEGSGANESEPTAAQRSIRLYKASLMMKISNELLEDTSNNLEAYLMDAIARAYAVNINTYLLGGSGNGQPQGVIPRISNSVTLASVSGISVDNVNAIFYGLPTAYHGNQTGWAMKMSTLGAIRALQTTGSFAFQNTPAGNSEGVERLQYRPVAITDGVSAMAASNKSVIFGNWNYAHFVEHTGGLKISRNPYLYENTGETAIFVTARWGSDVSQPEAFIRGTNPAS
jgi:HK97 family phage major capsid protein